jgi:hypothetical protein
MTQSASEDAADWRYQKTTIQVDKAIQRQLAQRKQSGENYNHVLQRLLSQETNVWVELILVDNELPQTHTVVLQLGEDPRNLYYFNGVAVKPVTLDAVQQLTKQPKPNITISRAEARALLFHFDTVRKPMSESDATLYARLHAFVNEGEAAI